jgi:hypothetical protein
MGIDENVDALMRVGLLEWRYEECDICLFSWKFQNKPAVVFSQHLPPHLPQQIHYLT